MEDLNNQRFQRLRQLDACAVSDALDALNLKGAALDLKRMWPNPRIAGQVMTVKLGLQGKRKSTRHLCTAAVETANAGDVIVVDNRGRLNVAGWGGILSLAAKQKGLSGVIVDGACRDVDESEEFAFPVYAKAAVPLTARGRIMEESYNKPVEICGIEVSPGDFVIADASGVVFIPADRIDEVLDKAELIVRKEKAMAENVRKGIPVSQVMGMDYETMLSQKE